MVTSGTETNRTCLFFSFDPEEVKSGREYYLAALVIYAAFSIPSALLNLLLLKSMYSALAFRKPSTLLLYSISVSDLLLALALMPVRLAHKIAELNYDSDKFCEIGLYIYVAGFILSGVSLFNLTAISIDRYLIVHRGVQYPEQVTKPRMKCVVIVIWVFSVVLSCLQLIASRKTAYRIIGCVLAICTSVITASYAKILWTLRRMKNEAKQLSETKEISGDARYRKTTITTLIVFIAFCLCYSPYVCTAVAINILGNSSKIMKSVEKLTTAVTYTRPMINALILLYRTEEIRKAAKIFIAKAISFYLWSEIHTSNILEI